MVCFISPITGDFSQPEDETTARKKLNYLFYNC